MTEMKISMGELQSHLKKMQKQYRMYEKGAEIADALINSDALISKYNGQVEEVKNNLDRTSKDLEIERSKLVICKKNVTDRNKIIIEKNKTIEKLDTYINGGFKKREAELDEEYNKLKREKDTEIREAQKLVDAKYDELNSVQTKLDAIKIELRKFKEALVV